MPTAPVKRAFHALCGTFAGRGGRHKIPPRPQSEEKVPSHAKSRPTGLLLCGVVNKYLTNYEDFEAVYLFGLQINS